jgi:Tfp pilus assembly protein PilO
MTYNEYVMMIVVFLLLSLVFSMLGWMGYTIAKLEKRINKMMRQTNDLQNGRRAKETH